MTLFQSGVLTLAGSETHGLEEVDIVLTYNTSTPAGRFSLLAAIDTIPQGYPATRSRNIGAFAQILKLSPILANQTYYIVIEGQIGILLHMTCMAATPS